MTSPLVTRRNGKKQACEPCRRRKVACDHGYPVCRRCMRRPNGESTCYYAVPGHTSQLEQSKLALDSRSKDHPSWPSGHVAPEDKFWSSPAARANPGFFGQSSLLTAYLETETTLAVQDPLITTEAAPSSESTLCDEATPPSAIEIQDMANKDTAATQLAVRVLQAIPGREKTTKAFFQLHSNPNDEWMRIIGERLIASTWETFGTYLRDRENRAKLRELGGLICINTRRVLKEDQEDPLAWLQSFSGSNLRWEAVGLMFMYAAFGEQSASTSADARKLIGNYTEYCSSCITLANIGGSSGSLMLFLLYKRSVLHACMHGDTSLPYWKFHAETVAMLTFAGYHDDRSRDAVASVSETTPPLEARRRIMCQIFIVDKNLATFVGRPPLLTRRFCSIKLPLDLDDTALVSDIEGFQEQVRALDSNGWNQSGHIHSSSILRFRMMVALIRDAILEIGLGYSDDSTIDDIMKLKTKELDLHEQLPTHMTGNLTFDDITSVDPRIVYSKLVMRLDHLLNLFLVERSLVKHGHSRGNLLRTSFEMVVLTMHFWTNRHRWAESQQECHWLIMGHAAPAGAVLCLELVDPNPVEGVADGQVIAGETYTRSSIIQQLSILVGFLNSSGPSQPNHCVASNARSVIKKVLDHVLNQTMQHQTPLGLRYFDSATGWESFAQFNPLDDISWFDQDWIPEESNSLK
ncbi:unnamed protein product [Clonostachys rosea]|uniref:Zn(2)-C6 fungal-type domain-containing protein n=1 Tax=Bionectria ochroleuca TaxID=29856 RepID=A0ABY6U2F0_BIOOC|nr:unnamed protein product [Clonostachys rosea]